MWRYESPKKSVKFCNGFAIFVFEQYPDSAQITRIEPKNGFTVWSKKYNSSASIINILECKKRNIIAVEYASRSSQYLCIDTETGNIISKLGRNVNSAELSLNENNLYITDDTRRIVWNTQTNRTQDVDYLPTLLYSHAFTYKGNVILTSSVKIFCIDSADFKIKWELPVDHASSFAWLNDTLYFGLPHTVGKLNLQNGRVKQIRKYKNLVDYEHGLIGARYAFILNSDVFYIFDKKDGRLVYGRKFHVPLFSQIENHKFYIYVSSPKGQIFCLRSPIINCTTMKTESIGRIWGQNSTFYIVE